MGVLIGAAAFLRCSHEDNRCHACAIPLRRCRDFLASSAEAVIDCPALRHATAITMQANVNGIVLGWNGVAERVNVGKRRALNVAPHTGNRLVLLALNIVVDFECCHVILILTPQR